MGSDGRRLITKITKATKITKNLLWVFFVVFVSFVGFVEKPWAVQSSQTWPQFRGNARLTGIGSELPATLSLKWTYEGGESFESSPAIVDGVV